MVDEAKIAEEKAAAEAKAAADKQAAADKAAAAEEKALAAKAKAAQPTQAEIDFVAKAMDYDGMLNWAWKNRPERCQNAQALAKSMILGFRACSRLGEVKKTTEAVKTGA